MPRGRTSAIYGGAAVVDGRGLPVTIDSNRGLIDKAGFSPEQLDEIVQNLINMVDGGSKLVLSSAPMLQKMMAMLEKEIDATLAAWEREAEAALLAPPGEIQAAGLTVKIATLLELSTKVSVIIERMNKTVMESARAKDIIVRLRTFIATGDEHDSGLEGMSENQLRRIINATANGDQIPLSERSG